MWEFELIHWLQGWGPWLVWPMKAVTQLGYAAAYIVIISFVYWCVSPGVGFRLALLVPFSGIINNELKVFIHEPRPYWVDTSITAYGIHKGFGMPSGHAQTAAVMWLGLATAVHRRWVWAACIAMTLLVGVSRPVLGVHFPTQVLVGWVVGAMIVYMFFRLEKPFMAMLEDRTMAMIAIAVLVTTALVVVGVYSRQLLDGWSVPTIWQNNSFAVCGPEGVIAPLRLKSIFAHSGMFLGIALGGILMHAKGWFRPAETWGRRIAAFALGFVVVVGLNAAGGAFYVSLGRETAAAWAAIMATGLLSGLWFTGLAPLVFLRLGWARPAEGA